MDAYSFEVERPKLTPARRELSVRTRYNHHHLMKRKRTVRWTGGPLLNKVSFLRTSGATSSSIPKGDPLEHATPNINQYDSSGDPGGLGEPQGSTCLGYMHYVELVEPRSLRVCIKCCDDSQDCPTDIVKESCPMAILGNYFDCRYNSWWIHRDGSKSYLSITDSGFLDFFLLDGF
ncbi:hypothetical protein BDM02DRAFT_1765486 [Thelephora ganbajun]|uniref:Uncharacterized protein n=1 Tax=Thelephora ganbajun TaxID=370292 RepID=A0ACB6ZKM1_THEGA|nr:hypothetical protein BDM02DRAFT_1765486 [Thelephora ganbajun]